MTIGLEVSPEEMGRLRLFFVATDTADGMALRNALATGAKDAGDLAARALGVDALDPWWVTLIQTADIADMGLAEFLAEGHDVPSAQLTEQAAVLDAARGAILLVQSPAFRGHGLTLAPAACLTPLVEFDTLRSPAAARPMARADVAPVAAAPPPKNLSTAPGKPLLRPIVVLGLLAIAALIVGMFALGGR